MTVELSAEVGHLLLAQLQPQAEAALRTFSLPCRRYLIMVLKINVSPVPERLVPFAPHERPPRRVPRRPEEPLHACSYRHPTPPQLRRRLR